MKKYVLIPIVIIILLFGALAFVQASDFGKSPLKGHFEEIERGEPYSWTITSRGEIRREPLLCDLEDDGHPELIIIDSSDGLIVVSAETGSEKWSYFPEEGSYSDTTPMLADFNSDSILDIAITTEAGVTAINGNNGIILWRTGNINQNQWGRLLAIDDFTTRDGNDVLFQFDNNSLALYEGDTGDLIWKTANRSLQTAAIDTNHSSTKNIVIIQDTDSYDQLGLLDGSTGETIWRANGNVVSESPLTIADLDTDGIYEIICGIMTVSGEEIVAINSFDGSVKWRSDPHQAIGNPQTLTMDMNQDGILEVISVRGVLRVYNGSDGSTIWTKSTSSDFLFADLANLSGDEEMELILVDHNNIYQVEKETGVTNWEREISSITDIAIADFDGDELEEIMCCSIYGEAFCVDGNNGEVIWYHHLGGRIIYIQSVESNGASPSIICTSTYFVSMIDITGIGPNALLLVTVFQYMPLIIALILCLVFIIVWKKGKLKLSALPEANRIRKLWNRILEIDSSSRRFKIILWIIILSAPWVVMLQIYDLTFYYLFAPTWYFFSMGISYGSRIYVSVLGFGTYGIQLSEIILLPALALPLILCAIILELSARRQVVFRMPRKFVIAHMIIIQAVGILMWTSRTWLVIFPIPIASIALLIADSIVRQSLPEIQKLTGVERAIPEAAKYLEVLRGGEFVGNRMRFKVKIANESDEVITDVKVAILSYPEESLKLESEPMRTVAKLEPKGFRSPTFEFLPTSDCVKGSIIATVSFVDYSGKAHSKTTEPFVIRAVCDLLRAQKVTPDEFVAKLSQLEHNDMVFKVEDWTPEEMHSKAIQSLEASNFYEVQSKFDEVGDHIQSKISGYAKGVYTGKDLGIEITISGKPTQKGATCTIRVSGEDVAMILPAIDEIAQKIQAWLCPVCAAKLPENIVSLLKEGKTANCPFCGVSMNR